MLFFALAMAFGAGCIGALGFDFFHGRLSYRTDLRDITIDQWCLLVGSVFFPVSLLVLYFR